MTKVRDLIKNAIKAIQVGDAKTTKTSVKEALLAKVRTRLAEKEKEVAKSFFSNSSNKKD